MVEEATRIFDWRYQLLRELGYDEAESQVLAQHTEIDVRRIETLVENGCPLDLAIDIVV